MSYFDGKGLNKKNYLRKKINKILKNRFIKKINIKKVIVLSDFNLKEVTKYHF